MPIDFDKMHEDAIANAKIQKDDAEKKIREDALNLERIKEQKIETLRNMIHAHLENAQQTLNLKGLNVQIGSNFEELKRTPYRSPQIWIQFYKDFEGNRPQYACGASYTCENGKIIAQTTEGARNNLIVKNAHECGVERIQCEQLVEKTVRECLSRLASQLED